MLIVKMGLMKAGKSKDVIETYKPMKDIYYKAGIAIGIFVYKPYDERKWVDIESRAFDNKIERVYNLANIKSASEVLEIFEFCHMVFIDEVQFAPLEHLNAIIEYAKTHDVFCYGLEKDYLSKPFESTWKLITMGAYFLDDYNVIRLEADCDYCGDLAEHNIRLTDDENLFVVEKEIYKTVCDKCKIEIDELRKPLENDEIEKEKST